jgi:hypothetical protein
VDFYRAVVAPSRGDRRGHGKNHEQCREKAKGSGELPVKYSGHVPSVDAGAASDVLWIVVVGLAGGTLPRKYYGD